MLAVILKGTTSRLLVTRGVATRVPHHHADTLQEHGGRARRRSHAVGSDEG